MHFRFRRDASVTDALFISRKFIDKAYAIKNPPLALLAFDYAKAFASIMHGRMLATLKRFGLPADFLAMINRITDIFSFRQWSRLDN